MKLKYAPKVPYVVILSLIAFISLGFPDGLLGVAWPSLRISFSRSLDSIAYLLAASTSGYLLSSFFGGRIVSRTGVGWLLAVSTAATGAGLLAFTIVPFWWMMIVFSFLAGSGAGAIDAGINTYVASHFGERVMQWLHASFGIGITLGPIIMTIGLDNFNSWRWGYYVVGLVQLSLAVCFALTNKVWYRDEDTDDPAYQKKAIDYKTPITETLGNLQVWRSILLFFIYAGIEAVSGTWFYTLFTEGRGISTPLGGITVGIYWAFFTLGRVAAGFYAKGGIIDSVIKKSLILAAAASLLLILNLGVAANIISAALIGFAIAPVFPGMVSLTSKRVEIRYTANTIGMQISAAGLGVAILPSLTGILAQRTSLEVIPLIIFFYS